MEPDPAPFNSVDDLVRKLAELRARAGNPSFRAIHRGVVALRAEHRIPERPVLNTVYRCFEQGRARPDLELIVDIVEVLSGSRESAARWRQAGRAVLYRELRASVVSVSTSLPAAVPDFCGRQEPLQQILSLATRPGPEKRILIEGMSGVGKTELALRAGAALRDHGFPRILVVNLRGFSSEPDTPAARPAAVHEEFLRSLGVPGHQIPASPAERAKLYQQQVSQIPTLVLLDNAYDAAQIEALVARGRQCLTLITSRRRLRDAANADVLTLEPFTAEEAVEYLRAAAGDPAVDADPASARAIVESLGRLPLALSQAAARIRRQRDWDLADHLRRLDERRDHLRLDDNVEVSFRASYDDCDPDLRFGLRMAALHPGTEFGEDAAQALIGIDIEATRAILDGLVEASLLKRRTENRYEIHDLVRVYAISRAQDEDAASARDHALRRLMTYYLAGASTAMDLVYPAERERRPRINHGNGDAEPPLSPAQARTWLHTERPNVLAIVQIAVDRGWDESVVPASQTLREFLQVNAFYADAIVLHTQAVAAARRLGDSRAEAIALQSLGTAYYELADYDLARSHLELALSIQREHDDRAAEAATVDNLGGIYFVSGRFDAAIEAYLRAQELNHAAGNIASEGRTTNNLGVVYLRVGRYEEAVEQLELAIDIAERTGDRAGQGALNNLGVAYARLGRHDEAVVCLEAALHAVREAQFPTGEAACLDSLGLAYRLAGRFTEALDQHRAALALARSIGAPALEADILNSTAETLEATEQLDQATETFQAAGTVATMIAMPQEQARSLDGMARCHARAGNLDEATALWRQALDLYIDLQLPEADAVRRSLSG